ncbi:hypothetical protein Dimus_004658 [Dionaea muscipula]
MDQQRHSVDIPISKALVALRRVRSLRDPSTNSMSKWDLSWDADSHNELSLRFQAGDEAGVRCKDRLVELKDYTFQEEILGDNKLQSKRHTDEVKDDGMELAFVSPSEYHLEGEDSNSNHKLNLVSTSLRWETRASRIQKLLHTDHQMRSPRSVGDVTSRVSSPFPCPTDSVDEEGDVLHHDYPPGCTVSCCWSRTPKFRTPAVLSEDEEDSALISGESGGTKISEQSMTWKNVSSEIVLYSGSPTSLSQKFQPRSFTELVGQSLVSRSLLGAISKGRITSLYIFHGPRGTGKTSASRIFAAALNCLALEDKKPCGMCRECVLYFTGRSRDVKEVDPVRISHGNRVRSLIKNATLPPVSSRYKVVIVDECQLLKDETWMALLHSLGSIPQSVVFILITPDLDKLPMEAVARSQKHHFPKIADADIAKRLGKICVQEGLEFDHSALDFIAAKSNGSLRDAEIMLDQLSLLGNRITPALAHELSGTVSDDELLELLDLAMSADTTNTVRRARELMRLKIDPMHLMSQLANIIMDIIAGKCQENSTTQRNFLKRRANEIGMQKLQHALKILSDCEKQLKTSENQTTWLTVALLQLNSQDSDANGSRLPLRQENLDDRDCCSTSSQDDRSKDHATCELPKMRVKEYVGTLESIWARATETCQSSPLRNLMRKRGKLASILVEKGIAVAELEFSRPNYVSKAEKSWKLIASSLQSVLGCNVEIRINLSSNSSLTRLAKVRQLSFRLFSCSCRMHHKSNSLIEDGTSKAVTGDMRPTDTYPSEVVSTLRNCDGNVLSTGTTTPRRSSGDCIFSDSGFGCYSSREEGSIDKYKVLMVQEPETQRPDCSCFCKTIRLHKKLLTLNSSKMVQLKFQKQDRIAVHAPREAFLDPFICSDYIDTSCDVPTANNTFTKHRYGLPRDTKTKLCCWKTRGNFL